MKKHSKLEEDFELSISATPENIDINATGDEAKELEEFARCVLGDNCNFFDTDFSEETDKADMQDKESVIKQEIDEPRTVEPDDLAATQLNGEDWSDLWDDIPNAGLVDPDVDEGLLLPNPIGALKDIKDNIDILEEKECCKEALKKGADMYDQVADELYAAGTAGRRGGADGKGHQIVLDGAERRYEADEIGIDDTDEKDNIKVTVDNPDDLAFAIKVADFFKVPYRMGKNWVKIYYYDNIDADTENLSECNLTEADDDLTDAEFIEAYKKIKSERR